MLRTPLSLARLRAGLGQFASSQIRRSRRRQRRLWSTESLEHRMMMVGDISGVVFDDVNRNGIDDPTENGLPGWTVFVDTNSDGQFTAGEPNTVTDVKGKYIITGLPAVATTVYEIPQGDYVPTPGFSDHRTITVRDRREVKVDFPNASAATTTGEITGTVFIDFNENGTKDSSEDGLAGWTMFIDTNADGTLTAGEPTTTTTAEGDYLFTSVAPGTMNVHEVPQGGYAPVASGLFPLVGATTYHQVTVVAGDSIKSDFANLIPPVGTIQGTVWNDANGDGVRQATETPLAERSVYVDVNSNGLLDAGEPARVTDANGQYAFANIHTGTYRVVETMPAGWVASVGRPSVITTNVFRGGTSIADFFNLVPSVGSISGFLWDDTDGNGIRSETELGLAGWQVFADGNSNGVLDATDITAVTDESGTYTLNDIPYGAITVGEIVPNGWIATNPGSASRSLIVLNGEQRTGVDFVNRKNIGTIQGTLWGDANGNRLTDSGETGLAGWTVFLDLDTNGVPGGAEPTAQTNATGQFTFLDVPVGHYSVSQVMPEGWIAAEGSTAVITTNVTIGGVSTANFYNLQPTVGSVSGRVWSDVNSNGTQEATETGFVGWSVFADRNADGVIDPTEPTATTDSDGNYTISDVPYGTTTIRQISPVGYVPTTPAARTSLLLNGENRTGVNFGVHEPNEFTIAGMVFSDVNHNGLRDPGENGISGVSLYIDSNDNGILDPTEPVAISSTDLFYTPAINEVGTYSFTHLPRGSYVVREIVPAELSATAASARIATVAVGPGSQVQTDFANTYRPNEIHGVVFDDTNSNGQRELNEYGRPGVTVYIDLNRDDIDDVDEPHATTAEDGSYAFTGLTPGAYIVREKSGATGPITYPTTGGGTLWPVGTSHPSVGNVTPGSITTTLANGETFAQTVTLTLPGVGSLSNLVDVFLLFDDTGSFTSNSPIVRAAFPTIMSTLQASLPGVDLGFGVGRLEEYGGFALEFAEGRPFVLNQPIVSSGTVGASAAIQAALDRMAPGYGGDAPETDIEALFQLVTGRGFDGNNNGSVLDSGRAGLAATQLTPGPSGDVPSFASFVADPSNGVLPAEGNVGGAGFRAGALPIVLLATDTGFAYQPKGELELVETGGVALPVSALTDSSRPTTPFSAGAGLQETITALNALGALVIGLGTNPEANIAPRSSLEALSLLTGATNRSANTIVNGTADSIAPGDPLYFQISSGFGGTVADGIVNAIQNGVTNVALDITIRASDPRVQIVNHTGTLLGVAAGGTASFDVEFIGDGRPHRFDLQFVRQGTNVVLGSIPVVLGTPVAGSGYGYDELEDGEIHHSSHFGHYVANSAPSFVAGDNQTVSEDAGIQTVTGWATGISPGPASESGQTVNFLVTTDNPTLFSVAPTVAADGTLTYTAAPNANGVALLTVTARDNGGVGLDGTDTSAPQAFSITVTPINDAPASAGDSYTIASSNVLSIGVAGVLGNDTDPDGDALTSRLVTAPTHGSVTLQADGSFEYQAELGYVGVDSFQYVSNDGLLDSNLATVTVDVTAVNHAPIASDDELTVNEDAVLSLSSAGILANDMDLDGDRITSVLVSGPTHGSLTLLPDGSLAYVPVANFFGDDTFSYQVSDGSLTSNVAQVIIHVAPANDAPIAVNDVFATLEDGVLTIATPGLLGNDTDPDGDLLRALRVTSPAHGTLTLNVNGSFVYTPTRNYNGTDSFTYVANDGSLNSNVSSVTITIGSVNDAPVSLADNYATTRDVPLVVPARGVLTNDSDVDGDALTAVLSTNPTHGTMVLNADGGFNYTPALGYVGPDSFSYIANDGTVGSTATTVTLTVAPPPAKFFVVDSGRLSTFQYAAEGNSLANNGLNRSNSKPRGIASNSTGTIQWVVDNGGSVFVYDNNSALLGQWQPQNVGKPEGITVWGNDLWLVDPAQDRVFKFNGGANLRTGRVNASSSFALNSGNLNSTDIVTDGAHLWVLNDTLAADRVFRYSTAGALEGSWALSTTNPSPTGITLDPTNVNHLWVVDASTDRVYQYDSATTRLNGTQEPGISFALSATNTNPQGIADPMPAANSQAIDDLFASGFGSAGHSVHDSVFAEMDNLTRRHRTARSRR